MSVPLPRPGSTSKQTTGNGIPSLLHPSSSAATDSQNRARLRNKTTNHPRQASGVYNTFSTKQIGGFKEAFNMLDSDSDGLINEKDLEIMLGNLGQLQVKGKNDVKKFMETALKDHNGGNGDTINFTQFLTMFGEHLAELDEATDLIEAFECFDERDDGVIDAGELRYWLSEVGDRLSDEEIDRLLSGPFMDRGGRNFDYKAFVEAVKMSEPAELE